MRSIEDVLRIKKRKLDELQQEINTLQAAAVIMDNEGELEHERLHASLHSALEKAAEAVAEPRGIPNAQVSSMTTKPEVKRWP